MKITVTSLMFLFLVATPALTSEPLKPALIIRLKEGHMKVCVSEITRQAVSIGLNFSATSVENYCRCLGNFYFNDLTTVDFEEMDVRGDLPERISKIRKQLQEYCSSLHLEQ
jgi:hypothetical protein